ncbi:MAG: sucrase ferredoxin [Actinomycetota bacterium]|nr:sucrase ferredoxin [Actinomycetota bacterium]
MIDAAPPRDRSVAEPRCATLSRAVGLDPVGTTGSHQGYLLVDVALPWPADVATIDEVAAVRAVLSGTGIRLQATVPVGHRRVVAYRPPPAGFAPSPALVRSETIVELSSGEGGDDVTRVVAAVERLMAGTVTEESAGLGGREREVIVCTHGRRDVCCGGRGTQLHQDLTSSPEPLGAAVSVRRTSHTGGHRFAPTAIVLPEATAWAYLDVDVLGAIVARAGPIASVLGHYRGWAGLGSPRLQALERAVLADVGWDLFDLPRWGEERDGTARLHVDGQVSTTTWEATVSAGRRVPRPDCGEGVSTNAKVDTEMVVNNLRRVN